MLIAPQVRKCAHTASIITEGKSTSLQSKVHIQAAGTLASNLRRVHLSAYCIEYYTSLLIHLYHRQLLYRIILPIMVLPVLWLGGVPRLP